MLAILSVCQVAATAKKWFSQSQVALVQLELKVKQAAFGVQLLSARGSASILPER